MSSRTAPPRAEARSGATAPARTRPPRPGLRGWARDLVLGLRFAVTGGRRGWVRTAFTGLGVGLGVALLLVAAAVPHVLASRDSREEARTVDTQGDTRRSDESFRYALTLTEYHDESVTGIVFRPDGDGPTAVPPGVDELPGPGEMAASPALAELLASPRGELLKERFPYRITATIEDSGLLGPGELRYYAGSAQLTDEQATGRASDFGRPMFSEPLNGVLLLIVLIGCVALLLPVGVFIATAARFGGEQRDRRLAALRLVGADRAMTNRVAAGESLCGALLGLLVGVGLFALLRQFASGVTILDVTAFSSDISPNPLLVTVIATAVPLSAVVVTLFSMRGVSVEPLGVVRNAAPRVRKLWWRLLAPVVGLLLLLAQAGQITMGSIAIDTFQIAAGAVLVLGGITSLLPWLVEAVVNRLDGGPVSWQLAIRRLQLSSGVAARAISGIVVAAAGAIALQMLFSSVQSDFTQTTGMDTERAQLEARADVRDGAEGRARMAEYAEAEGVTRVISLTESHLDRPGPGLKDEPSPVFTGLTVGDCSSLRELAKLSACEDGDVFLVRKGGYQGYPYQPKPGERVALPARGDDQRELWRVPASAIPVDSVFNPMGERTGGVLATPGAIDESRLANPLARAMIRLDPDVPNAAEHARNAVAALDPLTDVRALHGTETDSQFADIRTGLMVGVTATMTLIAVSLLVSTLEQLRDRKRLLAVLVAFGTRRSTLSWSVLWQTAVPIALGLALAVAGGIALGRVLLLMVGEPVADWWVFLPIVGVGAALIGLITLLSMPALWRLMRPDGLRSE
ncbi:ABC transporter permease [Streptomyces sp. NPDC001889]